MVDQTKPSVDPIATAATAAAAAAAATPAAAAVDAKTKAIGIVMGKGYSRTAAEEIVERYGVEQILGLTEIDPLVKPTSGDAPTHKEECGEVGETGDHGDLGENAG
jgi:hypothetical protein